MLGTVLDVSAARSMDRWIVVTLLMVLCCFTTASIMGDECDWTGSGLTSSGSTDHGRAVTPVYLRCTGGRVRWLYPRGALRLLLRLPSPGREFRACLRVRQLPGAASARLFLEGPRSLLPLWTQGDGGPRSIRCFQSKNGQAAIYVEATEGDTMARRVADIEYDLQALPRNGLGYDPSEECRPCTGEELAHAFCTSDLVTRGTIRAVENDEDLEITQMSVKVTKLIRHTTDDGYSNENDVEPNLVESHQRTDEVLLQVPRHCGVSHGVGEFVFMARKKLGELTLQCAPRLEDWATLVRTLTDEGKAHCVLRS